MKQTLKWHEDCIKNRTENLRKETEQLLKQMANLERCKKDLEFATLQYETAIKQGKSEYDNQRFLVPKTK